MPQTHFDDEKLDQFLTSIGANRLLEKIQDERMLIQYLEFRDAQERIAAEVQVELALQETFEQRINALYSAQFEKANSYNSVVITLGFAGLFAIWNEMSPDLHRWDSALIAVWLGASLLVYVFWVMVGMYLQAKQNAAIGRVVQQPFDTAAERQEAFERATASTQKAAVIMQGVWRWVFFTAASLGFGGGLILVSLAFLRVLGSDFAYYDLFACIYDWVLPLGGS